jgi:hypothetical protein
MLVGQADRCKSCRKSPQAQAKRRPFPTQASGLPRRKQIPRLCLFIPIQGGNKSHGYVYSFPYEEETNPTAMFHSFPYEEETNPTAMFHSFPYDEKMHNFRFPFLS